MNIPAHAAAGSINTAAISRVATTVSGFISENADPSGRKSGVIPLEAAGPAPQPPGDSPPFF
jgi:hypothetical protein